MIKGHSVLGFIVVSSTRYNKTLPLRRGFVVFGFGKQDLNLRQRRFDYQRKRYAGIAVSRQADERLCNSSVAQSNPLAPAEAGTATLSEPKQSILLFPDKNGLLLTANRRSRNDIG